MTKRLILSRIARSDLGDIYEFIANDNVKAARQVISSIYKAIRDLSRPPERGFVRKDIHPRLKRIIVHPYLIFFRSTAKTIEVARILHGARDLPALLKDIE